MGVFSVGKQKGPSRWDQILAQIQLATFGAQHDLRARKQLFKRLENEGDPKPRRVAMYYAQLTRGISHDDVLPFMSMLKGIGRVANLDLIVHSPGGDGVATDKMMDLCRRYCNGVLRVVVPLYAKSAATLMALSADEIVMGETSELGPIDAQVSIIQDNAPQQVSADHFLRAAKDATDKLSSANTGEVEAARIQLAIISPAFLTHCQDLQDFAKQFAKKQLQTHMFAVEYAADVPTWTVKINNVVQNLTTSGKYLSHGKTITASDIKSDPELNCLKVKSLADSDPYWLALDDLLQRTDVVAKTMKIGKVLMASDFQMVGA
jgi:ATP-dependent protease ClpP protease subunit